MRIEKSWGFEQILTNGAYCMKLLVYRKPLMSSLHYHENKHETFYISSGVFMVEVGPLGEIPQAYALPTELPKVGTGFSVVLPPRTLHRIHCLEPGTIVEASSHDDPEDCVRIVPSET
jgi:mannose-6-phosphate isomerase-like protein (cupin superfamily)